MAWNIDELQSKISTLELKILGVNDPVTKVGLQEDLYNLKSMVNYKLGKKVYPLQSYGTVILDREHFEDMVNSFRIYGPEIASQLYSVSFLHHVKSRPGISKCLSDDEFNILFRDFFKEFDVRLFDLYNEYVNERRIELSQNPYDSITCRGRCYPIISEGKSYISSKFNNRFSLITNIPHELAHAWQLNSQRNPVNIQHCLYSLFGEAYPIFIEYAFIDYLKRTKYSKAAYHEEAELINDFLCNLDYNIPNFHTMPDVKYNPNGSVSMQGIGAHIGCDTLLLSSVLAMFWYSLYRENPNYAKEEIDKFNLNFGTRYEGEVFSLYSPKELRHGVCDTINNYLDNYRRQ